MTNGKYTKTISDVQEYLINEYGHYFEQLGAKALHGRIFGLLVAHEGPMSLKSIAEELHVSKPAVSTNINYGVQSGIFKKVYIKEYPRESFFELRSDLMQSMLHPGFRKLNIMADKLAKALEMIEKSENDTDDREVEGLRKRIDFMKKSFDILLEEYQEFSERCVERLKEISPE
jgi:DNA-binding transcriptional regulator GbsR (MarR family)